jgi:predicted ATPase
LLALKGAKIYDLDANPVKIKRWTELENVRIYYGFFKSHDDKF